MFDVDRRALQRLEITRNEMRNKVAKEVWITSSRRDVVLLTLDVHSSLSCPVHVTKWFIARRVYG